MKTAILSLAVLALAPDLQAQVTLIPAGATWSYLDTGVTPAANWNDIVFDDLLWQSGPAQLGYGGNGEVTTVGFGPDSNNKFTTTWFRHEFEVPNPALYLSHELSVLRDDGAVVYVNGVEVLRSNMPSGTISSSTFASSTTGSTVESNFYPQSFIAALVPGTNVVAVEIHQRTLTSSDISFDLKFDGYTDVQLARGPYLQRSTPTSIDVRWRSFPASTARVQYGTAPGSLTSFIDDPVVTAEHSITIPGLAPDTKYYYSVGSPGQVLAGADANHFFTTHPLAGTNKATRIWALGDSGTANSDAASVRDAYASFTAQRATDLWLMLGDNAYNCGGDEEYQAAVFDMYPEFLRTSNLWPTRGNHETYASVYYDGFSMPTAGESGGMPSGTEAYYSFDYANVHFICLDSEGSDRSVGGAMHLWAEADLMSTNQDWLIAFWHHPPYTKGSHDSDTSSQLIEMRQNFVPLMEDLGVDLVLCGHSHSYERSLLIDGHYGLSGTFSGANVIDGTSGDPLLSGAYEKSAGAHEGTVYTVAGSSGKTSTAPFGHPAMVRELEVLGSVVLDIDGGRLDATFLQANGAISDRYTILKESFESYCFCTGGVCGNPDSLAGCGNSTIFGLAGGRLDVLAGSNSVARDDLVLIASQLPPNEFALFIVGGAPIQVPFGDGLRCVGNGPTTVSRLPVSQIPISGSLTQGPGIAAHSAAHFIPGAEITPGSTHYFQCWYRDAAGPCASSFNLTHGLRITFAP